MSFLAPALPFLTAGAGVMQAFGQYKQGQQAAAASSYNAQAYEQQAAAIKESAAADVVVGERNKAQIISHNIAAYAFRGVKISGSPLLALADTATNLEMDIRVGEHNKLIDAMRASSAASMEQMNARNFKMQGIVGAAGALLNTGVAMSNFTAGGSKSPAGTSQPPIGYQQKNKSGLLVSRY